MKDSSFDIVIIGAGSGGLTAARFASQLGARTALVERGRIGGDCTWTGCVPSKALVRAARVAHDVRRAHRYGIDAPPPAVHMEGVRRYVESAIGAVYQSETPEALKAVGIDVVLGAAEFIDPKTISVGGRRLTARRFLITTGARAGVPAIPGLETVPYLTYERLFEQGNLPATLAVIGGGPIGAEMAQAYQRLGCEVTLVARNLLPRDEAEAGSRLRLLFVREGIRTLDARATSVRLDGRRIVVEAEAGPVTTDQLLIATGRRPAVAGLGLERAGVAYSDRGIHVDAKLRTTVRHIYAAGDVTGGPQFTHYAAWQGFQAVRNALLPGSASGSSDFVPWVTYTDPEVARVGLTEAEARTQFGQGAIETHMREMAAVDRAITEDDADGFVKVITRRDGRILGATIVSGHAGEVVAEVVLAMRHKLKLQDLAGAIHPYPTYSTPLQQLASETAIRHTLSGVRGRWIRRWSGRVR